MSVAELQKKLIDKISGTNDAVLLEDILNFMHIDEAVGAIYELSDSRLSAVESSQQQIKNGNYFSDDEVNKEIDKWLEK